MMVVGQLRIVCLTCPSVATVRYQSFVPAWNAALVWVECHGTRVLASVDAMSIAKARIYADSNGLPTLILQSLPSMAPDRVKSLRDETEQQMLDLAARLEAFDMFLADRIKERLLLEADGHAQWPRNAWPVEEKSFPLPGVPCECDDTIAHPRGCMKAAYATVTRNGKRIRVCDRCDLTIDSDTVPLEESR